MTEEETCTAAYAIIKEGIACRQNGIANRYPANTMRHMLSSIGWLQEDLRIALMKANPVYRQGQTVFGQGLNEIGAVQ